MSNAKRCDKCKNFYMNDVTCFVDGEADWCKYSVIRNDHPHFQTEVDLCPACRDKLVRWLKENE